MLKLTLEFQSYSELQAFTQDMVALKPKAVPSNNAGPAPADSTAGEPAGAGTDVAAPDKPAAKRGPGRPKATPPAAAAEPAALPGLHPDSTILAAAFTEADVRAALMKVNDKHGADGLKVTGDVLKPFGVARIAELKPEQYQSVIDAAAKAAA